MTHFPFVDKSKDGRRPKGQQQKRNCSDPVKPVLRSGMDTPVRLEGFAHVTVDRNKRGWIWKCFSSLLAGKKRTDLCCCSSFCHTPQSPPHSLPQGLLSDTSILIYQHFHPHLPTLSVFWTYPNHLRSWTYDHTKTFSQQRHVAFFTGLCQAKWTESRCFAGLVDSLRLGLFLCLTPLQFCGGILAG